MKGAFPHGVTFTVAAVIIASTLGSFGKSGVAASQESPGLPAQAAALAELKPGGLTAYPVRELGPNLLQNPGFEQTDSSGKALNWTHSKYTVDSTSAHSGTKSLKLVDPNLISFSQSAYQILSLPKGTYTVRGWIKLQDVGSTSAGAVRLCLSGSPFPHSNGRRCTGELKGTSAWQYVEVKFVEITSDTTTARISLDEYSSPNGTAWFDDLEVREVLPLPVDVFMLYPNYRGMLFSDFPQIIKFNAIFNRPPSTPAGASLRVKASVVRESNGQVVLEKAIRVGTAPTANLSVEFDMAGKGALGDSFLVKFGLYNGLVKLYEYPSYKVVRVDGALRPEMTYSFDQYNRILHSGQPTFVLGVYDSGLGYTGSEAGWESSLGTNRRLFELPINMYLNYWFGGAPLTSMNALMNVLQRHGITYLQTGNCFAGGYKDTFPIHADPTYAIEFGKHPGAAGLYAMDECLPELAEPVFDDYLTFTERDPDGITFGVSTSPTYLEFWRDALDVSSIDSYPMYGAEPTNGYPLNRVGRSARGVNEAVMDSRPFFMVIQFFQFTSQGRWPTQPELRNMSYMAITEGSDGLFYWSIGANALAYICSGKDADTSPKGSTSWCPAKVRNFENLKAVISELKGLEPVLTSLDRPDLLAFNSNATAIRTRVKYVDGNGYLIAYNDTNGSADVTFSWSSVPAQVVVHNEGRTLAISGSSFSDSFGPYQAHVYEVSMAGGPTSTSSPAPTLTQTPTPILTSTSTPVPTLIPTLTATPSPVPTSPPNLLQNPGFESLDSSGHAVNWTYSRFSIDTGVAHSGTNSLKVVDPHLLPYTQIALQENMSLAQGRYTIRGWIKLENMASTQGKGVRICLSGSPFPWTFGRGCTAIIQGTSDWQFIEAKGIAITGNTSTARFYVEDYASPNGTAWFDDLELIRDP